MKVLAILFVSALLVFGAPAGPRAEQADCVHHALEPEQVKEQLRRWSGLEPFASWKITSIALAECTEEGRTQARLEIAPPTAWSLHDLPYRIWLVVPVEADTGQASTAPPEAWRELARGAKRMIARVERYEDVRRFIERFGVARAEMATTAEEGRYRVSLFADVLPGQTQPRVPSITYDESAPGRITAYRVPHMDSLPVRRELLRILELLSEHHPRCIPEWIDARQTGSAIPSEEPLRWIFHFELAGAGCPPSFAARLDTDGARKLSRPALLGAPEPPPTPGAGGDPP